MTGTTGRFDVSCDQCAWYYIDAEPPTGYQGTRSAVDEGWAPGASSFVRDLEAMAMREAKS